MTKTILNTTLRSRFPLWFVLLALAWSLAGCADGAASSPRVEAESGQVGLELQVGSGVVIEQASYVIIGAASFSKVGTLDLSSSSKLSALISGLPVGDDASITLNATTVGETATCSGSASFAVHAGSTTTVNLPVTCHEAPRGGGVALDAGINICPVIDELSSNPNQVAVGSSLSLSAVAHDSDVGPGPLDYRWSASAGALSSAGTQATLKCTAPGTVHVTLAVSDGSPDCTDSQQVDVECVGAGAAVPQPAPLPPVFMGLLALALLALGVRETRRCTFPITSCSKGAQPRSHV